VGTGKVRVDVQGFGEITGSPIQVSLLFQSESQVVQDSRTFGLDLQGSGD